MRRPTADELRKLKDRAAAAAAKGKLEKAADLFREAAQGDPRDVAARQKLAEVLRRAGRIPEAIQAYGEVADRFAKDGLLIKAIAISKAILELDPQHVETQSSLAALYAQRAAAEGTRLPSLTMERQAIAFAPAAGRPRPTPPGDARGPARDDVPEDGMVAIPLPGAPPFPEPEADAVPLEITIEPGLEIARTPRAPAGSEEAAAVPPPRRPGPAADTAFARICSAAEEAIGAGVDEDLFVEPEALGDVAGDEPLAAAPPDPEPAPAQAAVAMLPSEPADRAGGGAAPAAQPDPSRPPPASGLPRVPIFSDLSREAFLALTNGMVLHRVAEGDAVIGEREEGTSFYVVASGRLAVSKRDEAGGAVVVARLGEGDFFGEMALLTGAPRSATVTAESDAEVLELRADVLLAIAKHHPHVAESLRRFYRQRLLANAMAVSAIFRPFPRGERKLLMDRFRAREVSAGEKVVREGELSDGLYVVLEGAVDVVTRRDGREIIVGQLCEGDLFGEMSCLRKVPASASVVVTRPGTLLRLARSEFDDLVVTYPQILEAVSTLSEERAENLDAILSGHAQWTTEGLILI